MTGVPPRKRPLPSGPADFPRYVGSEAEALAEGYRYTALRRYGTGCTALASTVATIETGRGLFEPCIAVYADHGTGDYLYALPWLKALLDLSDTHGVVGVRREALLLAHAKGGLADGDLRVIRDLYQLGGRGAALAYLRSVTPSP